MVTVPADTPYNTPVEALILAIAVEALAQVPPVVVSVRVIVLPTQTTVEPPIEAGKGFTVILLVT